MSTLRVNKLENTNTSNGGISINSSGHVSIDGANFPTAGPLSNRNKVINGAMQVSQRATSESGISSSNAVRVLDRWQIRVNGTGTWTISQSTEAPPGFSNSIRWQCTTADASPAAGDFQYMAYRFEGLDVQDLAKGTSSAKPVTVSFWVRSTVTGSYSFRLVDSQNSRQIGQNYTVNQADTWEYKTMTFAGDTTGTLSSDNANRFSLFWWLVVGTDRTSGSIPTSWEASVTADEAAGQTANIASSTSNNFYITGVQLEVGETATPFEHRSYGDELAKCERYFQHSFNGAPSTSNTDNNGVVQHGGGNTGSTTGFIGAAHVQLIPDMRAQPLVTVYDLATPRNTNKTHRHVFGQAGSNNQQASISDGTEKSFNVRSDSGVNASGIIFHWKAEAEL